MSGEDFEPDPDMYWQPDAVNDRDEWDQHVRHVEEDERDRQTRDMGEAA